MKCLTHYVNVK